MRAIRWSDNDRYFGPFTWSADRAYRSLTAEITSGSGDEPGCFVRFSVAGYSLLVALPPIVRSTRRKVYPNWDAETVARLGRNWYYDGYPRTYGFYYAAGFLNFSFGRQTHDSSTEQRWGCFLPWTQWRHVRISYHGLSGEHVGTVRDADLPRGIERFNAQREMEAKIPKASFLFKDYDGEELTAETHIEEREWRFGTGWFKWLALFRRPKVLRSLDIRFSDETGRRKGSWKGGTIGHSIGMESGELHRAAFQRYCAEHEMIFLAPAIAG
jgi:hypothetical protein